MPRETLSIACIRERLLEVLEAVDRLPNDRGIGPLLRRCLIRLSSLAKIDSQPLH